MFLTRDEEDLLEGEGGQGKQKAMELLLAIGKIYDADRLIPISSAHLSGVSYKTAGEGGLKFLRQLSDVQVSVPTTLNPAGMDLERWEEMNVPPEFASKQLDIVSEYSRLGVDTCCTCTPYLHYNRPHQGDTVSWAESSALSFVNSVIGARTNREGGPGALAAAIVGKTPRYGLHLEEHRRLTVVVEADIREDVLSHSMLGQRVGEIVEDGIPYFTGITANTDNLKTLAAAMAASGSVAMFHVEGVTPESDNCDVGGLEKITIGQQEIEEAQLSLTTGNEPDLIALGCPHLSVREMRALASFLEGREKKVDKEVWFCTSRAVKEECPTEVEILEKVGKVVCDTCMVVAPIEHTHSTTGTNSAKACNYLPGLCSQRVICESSESLLEMIV